VRTTLTIDDDVAKLLKDEVRRSGDTFKGTVNRLLLKGIEESRNLKVRERFVVTPRALNTGLGTRYQKVQDLLEALEGPDYR
jgi:hypothetical protein